MRITKGGADGVIGCRGRVVQRVTGGVSESHPRSRCRLTVHTFSRHGLDGNLRITSAPPTTTTTSTRPKYLHPLWLFTNCRSSLLFLFFKLSLLNSQVGAGYMRMYSDRTVPTLPQSLDAQAPQRPSPCDGLRKRAPTSYVNTTCHS